MLSMLVALAVAGPVEDSASRYAQAHADIARVLGFVSVHCPFPDAPDGRLVGEFTQQVDRGWYSNVERGMEGVHVVEAQVGNRDDGRPDYRSEHIMRWSASGPGEAVRCTIEPIQRVPVTIVVKDAERKPVAGTKVYGCGIRGKTGPDGTLQAKAYSHQRCEVKSFSNHAQTFRPDVHAGGELHLKPRVREPTTYDPAAEAEETRSMIEVYEGLLPLATSAEGKELLENNLKRRRKLLLPQDCHAGDAAKCTAYGPMKPFSDRLPTPLPR